MTVIVLLIVAGGVVAAGFLAAFAWAVRSGQYDDTCTPAVRVLLEDGKTTSGASPSSLPVFQSSCLQKGMSHVDGHE
jgi:cbb3-type cytochrome oxidase maturation protein